MKYLHEIQQEADDAREREYLDSIGFFGRLIDNHLTYPFVLVVACMLGFNLGILIGVML